MIFQNKDIVIDNIIYIAIIRCEKCNDQKSVQLIGLNDFVYFG